MSEPIPFTPYACSRGLVVAHEGNSYLIDSPSEGLIGWPANSTPGEANVETDLANPPAFPAPVPTEVTPLQMRRALNASDLRAAVEQAVAAAPQDMRDAWEFASVVRRDDPLLAAMAAALGQTSEQVDNLFRLAATFQ